MALISGGYLASSIGLAFGQASTRWFAHLRMKSRPFVAQPSENAYSSIRETHDGAGRRRSGSASRRFATAAIAA